MVTSPVHQVIIVHNVKPLYHLNERVRKELTHLTVVMKEEISDETKTVF